MCSRTGEGSKGCDVKETWLFRVLNQHPEFSPETPDVFDLITLAAWKSAQIASSLLLYVSLPHSPWQMCREVYLQKGWEENVVIKKNPYGLSNNMQKPFIWLLDIQFIYLLSFITKYFIVKLKNFCPSSQVCLFGFFYSLTWDMVLLGKQSFSPLHWKTVFTELSGEILSTGGMEILQGISAFAFRRKEGKSELLGSALTVLLVQWFCSMTRSSVGSPCSCFGSGHWC